MRRPVKYKTRQAARNRLIGMITASVLGVAVIGGASAAVLLSRGDDGIDGVGTGTGGIVPSVTDTEELPVGTDTDGVSTDTQVPVTDVPTETLPVTEPVTEPVTQPPETAAPTVTDAPASGMAPRAVDTLTIR